MKRVYEKPSMEVECFEANEYVAACWDVSASCTIYSQAADLADNGRIDGYVVGPDGLWHGTACQNNTLIVDDTTLSGYENSTGSRIYNVGTNSWNSQDSAGNVYTHIGSVVWTQQDPKRPNHS